MTTRQHRLKQWSDWTLEIKVWKLLTALVIVTILVLWFRVVHQNDEILALVRNDVATDASGQRTWSGSFINTNARSLRDVAVAVDFLDSQGRAVGRTAAEAADLPFGKQVDLQARLPTQAVKLRVYSVQWRMGRIGVLMGPFREPWNFGYLMADPARINP